MKPVSIDLARALMDLAPAGGALRTGFGESQLEGAVAAFNMLARNRVAYLADEVGMGKTYVALGVLGLFRHLHPGSRILVLAPRENIQRKWIKELGNFTRVNWKRVDNRVKSLQGTPVREPVPCGSVIELVHAVRIRPDADLFLRMTSFSARVQEAEDRRRVRRALLPLLPWLEDGALSARDPVEFLAQYGRAVNAVLPEIDLLIVDEAHNLKQGFARAASVRNRMLAHVFGHPDGGDGNPGYGPRVRCLLCLSATPFEEDYADLYRQIALFGLGGIRIADARGEGRVPLDRLIDRETDDAARRDLVRRFLVRRVAHLNVVGERRTKNLYRREWRGGGYATHDDPMAVDDPRQRLAVALVQKKVAEILGDRRFNNHFQIGMLSSFESFLESFSRRRVRPVASQDEDTEPTFDGDQEATPLERRGIDSHALEALVRSHRERFDRGLPHPKLDTTAEALGSVFETGEKALVFVRRVATSAELRARIEAHFDRWIHRRMRDALPELEDEIGDLFARYARARRESTEPDPDTESPAPDGDDAAAETLFEIEEDSGGSETFFAWFFRGEGPRGILSGAAFQKNRLSSLSSVYSTLFEDDHVAWLLGRPPDVVGKLAEVLERPRPALEAALRERAWRHFRGRTARRERYPRFYVFESYQVAALDLLAETGGDLGEKARIVLRERYRAPEEVGGEPPEGFPPPADGLGITSFITELVRDPPLRDALWPDAPDLPFRERFRRREQRRELVSAMARLGASYIDLYLLAIRQLGSFALGGQTEAEDPERSLAREFLTLLAAQRDKPGFHAFAELSGAAAAFDTLIAVNFPEVPDADLSRLAEIYGRTLQHQVPVARMAGRVNPRVVRQFRMPGFPIVLVTTDVLQEGEDLHTFCRRIIHYGITWTPSAMEQRTGRIDRIGSLFQRRYDGRDLRPEPDDLIQVYYPFLQDTVEVLQVRRVLDRLDRFMRLVHRGEDRGLTDSRIDATRELTEARTPLGPVAGVLESAFPVAGEWLEGSVGAEAAVTVDLEVLRACLDAMWTELIETYPAQAFETGVPLRRAGSVRLRHGEIRRRGEGTPRPGTREQPFGMTLRSAAGGSATLLRISSPVGILDLHDDETVDRLYELQRDLGFIRICAWPDARHRAHQVVVREDLLFSPESTQFTEVARAFLRVVTAADRIEEALLARDDPAARWLSKATAEEASDADA